MATARIALIIFAAAGVLAYLAWDQQSRDTAVASNEIIELRVGATRLMVDARLMDREQARMGGRVGELRLSVDANGFGPAPPLHPLAPDAREAMPEVIHLRLSAKSSDLEPADRTSKLYSRFLDSDSASGVAGLRVRKFEDDSPYRGEDLYFYPPEGRLFAARCLRQNEDPGSAPGTCLAYMRAGDLDVQMRFSGALIENWERLVEGVQGLVASFRK